jgi:hypothetical protein
MNEEISRAEYERHRRQNQILVNRLLELGINLDEVRLIDLCFVMPTIETLLRFFRLSFDYNLPKTIYARALHESERSGQTYVIAPISTTIITVVRPSVVKHYIRLATEAGGLYDCWHIPDAPGLAEDVGADMTV